MQLGHRAATPPPPWQDGVMPIRRRTVAIKLNGAEYLELEAGAREAGLTLAAYVRTKAGLSPWLARGIERQQSTAPPGPPRQAGHVMALDRLKFSIETTEEEFTGLLAQAQAHEGWALTVPQYIRTRCGFLVRFTSLPNTEERDREEDDAWDRLRRLGLKPEEYFPPDPLPPLPPDPRHTASTRLLVSATKPPSAPRFALDQSSNS